MVTIRFNTLICFTVTALIIITLLVSSPAFGRLVYPIRYPDELQQRVQEFELDFIMVASMIHTESKFNPKAISPRGAVGLMQLMPETATWVVQQLDWQQFTPQQLFEPEINIHLGCWYIANLYDELKDTVKVIVAYNAGRGNVQHWLSQGLWDGTAEQAYTIPFGESRHYLKRVLRTIEIYDRLYNANTWFWWK